jgi:hypothetical protein
MAKAITRRCGRGGGDQNYEDKREFCRKEICSMRMGGCDNGKTPRERSQFHCRCLLWICVNRLLFCVVRCGQWGHWNCGSLPHSNLIWLIMFFLQRYTFPHPGHWKDPTPDHFLTFSTPHTLPTVILVGGCSPQSNWVTCSSRKFKLLLLLWFTKLLGHSVFLCTLTSLKLWLEYITRPSLWNPVMLPATN